MSIPVCYEAELRWPEDVPMNWEPRDSRFGTHSLDNAISWVTNEAMHLGAKEITFTAAMKLGKRGQPIETARQRGPIAVWYTTDETPNPVCIAIGEYHFLVDNLWAVGHTLAAPPPAPAAHPRRHAHDPAPRRRLGRAAISAGVRRSASQAQVVGDPWRHQGLPARGCGGCLPCPRPQGAPRPGWKPRGDDYPERRHR